MTTSASSQRSLREAMIGRALGDARERAGLTQAAAAKKVGMPQSTVAEIETGQRPIRLSEALSFLEIYGLRLEDLDIRGRDATFAKVKRDRGRPRKVEVEFEFSSGRDVMARAAILFEQIKSLQDQWGPMGRDLESAIDELAALTLRLARLSDIDVRTRRAVRALVGAACAWTGPRSQLLDPVCLFGMARDLLAGRVSVTEALLR